ncbi:S9 family peptidase [Shewanella sp. C32]|uniref:S9 family peptidase n=1 Tax=Shewanella electrica TaxID=515560 RepID=A0ABT2FNC0_9GAMM|nr:S9 family peptidase [Shewanella electrica]MCH1926105.1 S9 family peptidase [Shewanella electrica]MCS4557526.1 S9 family peptidase [Shewanella electrica]
MKLINLLVGTATALTLLSGCATSEPATPSQSMLTLQQIFHDKAFKPERAPYFRWLDDGSGYTVLESRDKSAEKPKPGEEEEHGVKGSDIVFYQADGTGRKVLVSLEQLTPKDAKEALTIEDYRWSDDGNWLLVFTNAEKVWRSRSRGDYWVLNLKTNQLQQVGGATPEGKSLMFAKFSPDSQRVAYVQHNNIFMESLTGKDAAKHKVTQLTFDGTDSLINGHFDWVYEEEFTIRDGFEWSPDSQNIAYWQLDSSGVKQFTMINNTDALYPTITQFPYPKAGEQNSAVRIGVVNINDAKTRWAPLPGDNRDRYVPRISWAGTSAAVMIQDVNRPQNSNVLRLFDWQHEQLSTILTEHDDAFLEWYYSAEWEKDGSHFIWHSERDGWRHLYRVSRDGKSVVDLTPGAYDIVDLLTLNEATNSLYFTASPDHPESRYLYRANLDGTGKLERLTPAQFQGSNSYYISKDGSLAMHSHSRFDVPSSNEIIKVDGHQTIKALTDNAELKAKLATVDLPKHQFFQVNARDGVALDGWIMFPPHMDPNKKYPIIFYVYGEPWGSTVQDRWGGGNYLWSSMMAQRGFIMASIDNRGTRAPKGRDWRKSIYKKIGSITVRDQVDALDAMAKRWNVIDTERVGVWGHSGGGSSTLNLLFRHGDKFKVGAAFAPVADIHLYDSIYQERYSGNPNTDPDSYIQTSPITFAKDLTGHLLLVHGTGDDNVHYQGTEKLINELVKHNKQFEFMSYPNRTHSLSEGAGTSLHLMTLKTEFFEKYLKPETNAAN